MKKSVIVFFGIFIVIVLFTACPSNPDNGLDTQTPNAPTASAILPDHTSALIPTLMPTPSPVYVSEIDRIKAERDDLYNSKPFEEMSPDEKDHALFLDYYIHWYEMTSWGPDTASIPTPPNYELYPYNQEVMVDLNGDGKPDKIMVIPYENNYDIGLKIIINGLEYDYREYQDNINFWLRDCFEVVDIDMNDRYKEIFIKGMTPGGAFVYHFFSYDGEKIVFMSEDTYESIRPPDEYLLGLHGIRDWGGNINFVGNGEIIAYQRAKILQTWFYPLRFVLTEEHLLRAIPEEIYKTDYEVFVLKEIPLYTERDETSPTIIMEKSTIVTLTGLDNIEWIQVTLADGQVGWFKIKEFMFIVIGDEEIVGTDVFFPLSMAG